MSVINDSNDREWIIHDPFRDSFYGDLKTRSGLDMTKQLAPLLSADVMELKDEFKVFVDAPGVDPEDIEVTFEDNVLSIKAVRRHDYDVVKDKVIRLECCYGRAQRKILLPTNAMLNNASVSFQNGVLCVSMPKKHLEVLNT